MKVLGLSGSLRENSYNTKLLRSVEQLLPTAVEFEIYTELESLPAYNEDRDLDGGPKEARFLREAIASADALIVATPEYNSSIPGQLKNAVDWGSRPFQSGVLWNKPVAVIGASRGEYGALWAQMELRKALGTAGARNIGGELPLRKAHEQFADDGTLIDTGYVERLRELVEELLAQSEQSSDRKLASETM